MSQQLCSEPAATTGQQINPALQLPVDEMVVTEVASSLRQRSRDLRAASETLRSKNLEVMKNANAVTGRYYDLIFGEV